jgi:NADPH-dependent glutamate synthase beta subunit-like oxidoreductase
MLGMLGGILVMGTVGVVVGVGLALASKIFYVYVDPKIEAVDEALPGANCGGCGYPGCCSNAEAIVAGKSSPSSCVACGPEIAEEIAEIMGMKLEAREPDIAMPGCSYGLHVADVKYIYNGINDCRAAALLNGGTKVCPIGCLGLGTCVRACPFDALSMGPDNLPVVDPDRCTGCGTCERICPKHIITLTSHTRRIQAEHTTDECTAPCQRACPAGIDIPAYIHQIAEKNYAEAVRIIKETNPFPAICGRICVQPCEYDCRRNLVDEPVAINHLKRFVSDYERTSGERIHVPRAPETGKRIAVVGGGAEGLTAAYLLNRLGHDSTAYEATAQMGGILRIGLPENRLPRDVLDWEINGILDAGVQALTNQKLGRDFTIDSLLKEGFSGVFVATGGWDSQLSDQLSEKSDGPLQTLPGVQLLIDFILNQRAGKASPAGKNVMILGGGKSGLEAARTALKNGSENVYIVLRSSLERSSFPKEELVAAEQEGIQFYFQTAVTRMQGEGSKLSHVEIAHILNSDEEKTHIERELLSVDTLLTGAGRFPELIYVVRKEEGEADEEEEAELPDPVPWETLIPYPGPSAEEDIGIFRPGEVTGDYKAVVEAIGSGRRAASSIHRFLTDEPVEAPANMIRTYTRVLSLEQLEPVTELPREKMPELTHEEQIADPSAEIALGFSEEQAVTEAKRCLQCGLICYRRVEGKTIH